MARKILVDGVMLDVLEEDTGYGVAAECDDYGERSTSPFVRPLVVMPSSGEIGMAVRWRRARRDSEHFVDSYNYPDGLRHRAELAVAKRRKRT